MTPRPCLSGEKLQEKASFIMYNRRCCNEWLNYIVKLIVVSRHMRDQSTPLDRNISLFGWFYCFTSQVNSYGQWGRSVHLTTLFPGQAWTSGLPVIRAHTFACNWQQPFLNESAEGRRMTVEIISWSISTKVWDRAGIELATPGIAVRHASVARHATDCATRPGMEHFSTPDIITSLVDLCWGVYNHYIM